MEARFTYLEQLSAQLDQKLTAALGTFAQLGNQLGTFAERQQADQDLLTTGLDALEHRQTADRDQLTAALDAQEHLQAQSDKLSEALDLLTHLQTEDRDRLLGRL